MLEANENDINYKNIDFLKLEFVLLTFAYLIRLKSELNNIKDIAIGIIILAAISDTFLDNENFDF
jgi:hypothetical protein